MEKQRLSFLQGGGEMGELIARYNWSVTNLGSVEKWSPCFRAHINMMLSSRFPMLIFWTKELITFYNDAFRPSLGDNGKHPSSLGQKGEVSWAESWPVIGPMIYNIMNGGNAVWFEDQKLPIYREGKMDYAYWTYSFSPIIDDGENIAGVLVTCAETTKGVESLNKLAVLQEQQEMAIEAAELGTWDLNAASGNFNANARLKHWFGLQPEQEIALTLALEVISPADRERVAAAINYAMQPTSGGRYEEIYTIIHPSTKEERIVQAKGRAEFNDTGEAVRLNGTLRDITQQMHLQQKKEQEQRYLLSLFEQSSIGIAIIGKDDLTFKMANAFYGVLVDRKPEDIVGKPLLQALPEIKGQGFDVRLNNVMETGKAFIANAVAIDIKRGDSIQTIYIDLAYQPMREDDKSISGVLVIATDVTQAVLTRKNIEISEAKFRSLITEAPFATAVYEGDSFIVDIANDVIINLWGKTATVIGKPLVNALPELEEQPFIGLLQEVRRTGIAYQSNEQSTDLVIDGELKRFWFNFIYKPLFNEEGEVYAILNMAVDVSEQVAARKKVEEAELKLLAAIDLAELGTWSVDVETGKVTYSSQLQQWLGIEEGKVQPDGSPNVVEADRMRIQQAIVKALEPGSNGELDETYTIINKKTGQQRIIHANGKVINDLNGKPVTLTGTAQDVTIQQQLKLALENEVQQRTEELAAAVEELRATNEDMAEVNSQLLHSNEELAQYAYVASHDLQEPLRKIRMFSSLLSGTENTPEFTQQTLERIQQSAERMSLLISDLLDFSRLLKSDSIFQPVDLADVLSNMKKDFELVIAEKDAHIHVGKLPAIKAVRLQMNQLFYNLVGNALKFSKPGVPPVINVDARPASIREIQEHIEKPVSENYYLISVKDNGIGIAPQFTEQIFELFKRLHGRTEYAGSGIGLSVCRRIVQNHHGKLYADSEQGRGTTFFILLPA